jgi:biopolymer transport protein ExbB
VRAETAGGIENYVEAVQHAEQGMTMWEVLKSGGVTMVILGLLSILMVALITFLLARLRVARLIPPDIKHKVLEGLRKRHYPEVRTLCRNEDNLVASIAMAGLETGPGGDILPKEAIEATARKEVVQLWAMIHPLTDIAAIAPMLGLLGTVVGMIQAFNTIAFQSAVVKPMLLAGGVSKAMVTTAAGMVISIAAMAFYSYFRFRVQTITALTEDLGAEIGDALAGASNPKATH